MKSSAVSAPLREAFSAESLPQLLPRKELVGAFHDGDDDDASFGDGEPSAAVAVEVEADFGSGGDFYVLVDDRAADGGACADLDASEEDRVGDFCLFFDAHLGADDAAGDAASGEDRAGGDQAVEGFAATAGVFVEDELGGRQVGLVGAHGPAVVVEVEQRLDAG